jgi:hypothetical protein
LLDKRDILEAIVKAQRAFKIEDFCFKEQLAFIKDPARFKAADCSRRAGKTVGIAADLLDTASKNPRMACLYITLSRLNAKRILWPDLLEINREYGLGGKPHETELTLTMPNGHIIYLSGAKDKSEVEKYRGFPLKKVYIDEAQSFRAYIQELVDDVLAKSLYDFNGSLALTGTPPPLPSGYFHDCVHNEKWSRHSWNMLQNPHLKAKSGRDPMSLILEDCERMGVGVDDPRIQRECFGRWVIDRSSLVFRYSDGNHYDSLPDGGKWEHVIGVDLGYSDADAVAVIGWSSAGPETYLIAEHVKRKQGITELASLLEHLIRQYDPLAVVMDTGGLGKKIAEEMRSRFGLPIKAAEKTEKYAHIELVNDALRTNRLYAKRSSQFASDSGLLEWDRDKSSGDRLVVSDAFHSDICDAVLYAYRESLHWLHMPQRAKAKVGSKEWLKAQEDELEEALTSSLSRDLEDPANWGEPQLETA